MNQDLEDKIVDVQKSVEKLAVQVGKMVGEKVDEGMEAEGEMLDAAKKNVKRVVKMGKEKTDEVDEFVNENPWLAVAAVAVVALAVGVVMGHANKKD